MKDPKSQVVTHDGTATFEITVSNPGDVALADVTVSDPLSPDCNRSLGTLAPGASTAYSCTKAAVRTSFVNVVTAVGTPPKGPNVTSRDHAPVTAGPFTPPPSKHVKKPPVKHPKPHHKKPKHKPHVVIKHQKPKTTG